MEQARTPIPFVHTSINLSTTDTRDIRTSFARRLGHARMRPPVKRGHPVTRGATGRVHGWRVFPSDGCHPDAPLGRRTWADEPHATERGGDARVSCACRRPQSRGRLECMVGWLRPPKTGGNEHYRDALTLGGSQRGRALRRVSRLPGVSPEWGTHQGAGAKAPGTRARDP